METQYLETNKSLWNDKTEVHLNSEFYDNPTFIEGRNSLNEIELALLEDISGKSVIHFQCHFGQDTISLARLGASKAVGIDLSDKAIAAAKTLAADTNSAAEFHCCDVYSVDQHVQEQFDIVYTSYGTIGWLPDLDRWAEQISKRLKPGGKVVFVEFHPAVWMFDDDFTKIEYSYFQSDAIIDENEETYTENGAETKGTAISWNHSLSAVVNALMKFGMTIEDFQEYDYSPYDCFSKTVRHPKGYQIENLENKLPMVYSIVAKKP